MTLLELQQIRLDNMTPESFGDLLPSILDILREMSSSEFERNANVYMYFTEYIEGIASGFYSGYSRCERLKWCDFGLEIARRIADRSADAFGAENRTYCSLLSSREKLRD